MLSSVSSSTVVVATSTAITTNSCCGCCRVFHVFQLVLCVIPREFCLWLHQISGPAQRQEPSLLQLAAEEYFRPCSFEPEFVRPAPLVLEPTEEEVIWLNPCGTHAVLWDYSMCGDNSRGAQVRWHACPWRYRFPAGHVLKIVCLLGCCAVGWAQVRELMAKAFKGPLVPQQQQHVLGQLEADAKLVYHCGLTPKRLPGPDFSLRPARIPWRHRRGANFDARASDRSGGE